MSRIAHSSVPLRPIRIDGDVAHVDLTRGKVSIIDAADVHLIEGKNWQAKPCLNTFYANRSASINGEKVTTSIHRVLMSPPDGLMVDHIDGNGLNNRRSNLRITTASQNQSNRRHQNTEKSLPKGVSFHKQTGKWSARITKNGAVHWLGLFDDPPTAHAAYREASKHYHGEFGVCFDR